MTWVKFDDLFPGHWKVAPLSDAAFRAHVTAICIAASHLTDGFIDTGTAKGLTRRRPVLAELTRERTNPITGEKSRIWEPVEDGFRIYHYLEFQPTRAQVEEERKERHEQKAAAGRAGAQARWHGDSRSNGRTGNRRMAESMADG